MVSPSSPIAIRPTNPPQANGGIGFELVNQLMAKGTYHVLLGSRSVDKGNAAIKDLQFRNPSGSVELVELDVTKDDHIERAAKSVEQNHGKLDILVNNAAIVPSDPPLRKQMQDSFNTNVTGPTVLTAAFAHLLQRSTTESPRIINVSSGAGSIARVQDPSSPMYKFKAEQYRASKAALNMVTAVQSVEFGPGIKVFAYCPGFTVSNLSGMNTAENGARETRESVLPLMDVLEGKRDDEAGGFL